MNYIFENWNLKVKKFNDLRDAKTKLKQFDSTYKVLFLIMQKTSEWIIIEKIINTAYLIFRSVTSQPKYIFFTINKKTTKNISTSAIKNCLNLVQQ